MNSSFHCPNCRAQYSRTDFPADETYLECDACATGLVPGRAPDDSRLEATSSLLPGARNEDYSMRFLALALTAAAIVRWFVGRWLVAVVVVLVGVALLFAYRRWRAMNVS